MYTVYCSLKTQRDVLYENYRLCTNLCICRNCMNNVDCETRRNLVIEPQLVTGGKFMYMKMSKVALRTGQKARQKTGNQQK